MLKRFTHSSDEEVSVHMKQKTHKATLKDVLKAFWSGIRPQRFSLWVLLVIFPVANIIQLLAPLYYKEFFDTISGEVLDKSVLAPALVDLIIIIFILHATAWLLIRGGIYVLNYFESGVIARLKQMSFDYVIDHSHTFFSNTFAGSLVQRISRFGRAFEHLTDTFLFSLIPLVVNIIGATIIVWFQKPVIALIIIVWVTIVMAFNYLFSRWKLKYDLASAAADTATTARLADAIGNHATISSFTGSQSESQSFKDTTLHQSRAMRLTWNLSSTLDTVQSAFIVIVEFLLFYYAIIYWKEGTITVGTFVLIQVYIIGLAQRLWDFGRIIRTAYQGYADSQEMVDILVTPHEIQDIKDAQPLTISSGEIIFSDATFQYSPTQIAFDHVDLRIPAGQKVALIGHSGAGKSTLVKLLLRLHDLTGGTISIDGQDIQKGTQKSLRESMSLVPQDPILFHRTLMENIRYGRRDATDAEVISAAKLAHCDDFIDMLPEKYHTYVGERGVKLSGGERQRVAIARAILKNAPILVLDEATSSLDSHSESLIQDALDKLMKEHTTLVIAHRLSTIRKMDRIIVLDKGKIVEDGSHEELLAKKGIYSELWDHQSGGYMKDE